MGAASDAAGARTASVRATRRRALAVLAALCVGACAAPLPLDGPGVAELPAPVPDWVAVRVDERDHGRRVELAAGASLAVALRVPAAAGIGWVAAGVPEPLRLTGRSSGPVWPPDAPRSAVAPAPIWQVFVFEALSPGEGTLVLERTGGDPTARPVRFTLRVSVTGG